MKNLLKKSILSAVLVLTLPACAITPLAALPIAVSGSAAGIDYSFTNVAYKTISRPRGAVEAALHKALKKMAIKETKLDATDGKIKIWAETPNLGIAIVLVKITPTVTRMSVNAVHAVFFKDKATATEIIVQTEKAL